MARGPITWLIALHFATVAICATSLSEASHIEWSNCTQKGTGPISCAGLKVPLDYTDPHSNETINLQLLKVNAVNEPTKGSILLNFGGPGETSRSSLVALAQELLVMSGGHYNLIAFEPRGTGDTIPFSCYASESARAAANAVAPSALKSSDTALGTVWATRLMLAEQCLEKAGNVGELIGTAFVARDMMQIVDALGGDGLLRYWGFSYGTALGETVAAMFPERMDKVVLDGVLNPSEYYAGRELQEVLRSDATFQGFFTGCAQAPKYCPLARKDRSARELSEMVFDLLETVKYHPIPLGTDPTVDLVTYDNLKSLTELALYATNDWPRLATVFNAVFTRNLTAYLDAAEELLGIFDPSPLFPEKQGSEALQGIRCSDTALRSDNLTELLPTLHEFYAESAVLGDMEPIPVFLSCARWRMKAKEVYTGGFHDLHTRSPILFVGSPFDPLTPLASACNASAAFEKSAVLQHRGYGHTSLAQPSVCVGKAIQAYFDNGTLPVAGKICEPSAPAFRSSDAQVTAPSASKRSLLEGDDAMLLDAMERVGRGILGRR